MTTYNIGFFNSDGEYDATQLDVEKSTQYNEFIELINLILSLKEEMDIDEITYIEEA